MAYKITDIKSQQKKAGRYSVYVDDKFAFGVSEEQLLKLEIYQGQELEEQELEELKTQLDSDKIYQRALRYIGLRPRSEHEMRDYLKRKEHQPDSIDGCIAQLKQADLLDDAKFARDWIEWRQATTPRSRRKLWAELKQKGIDDELIDSALEKVDGDREVETVKQIIDKKGSRYDTREKLMSYLGRQGFSYDSIRQAFDEIE